MKKLFLATCMITSTTIHAQLEKGMLAYGSFGEEDQTYVAEITAVNGNQITYHFVQSGFSYTMQKERSPGDPMYIGSHIATVISNVGGKYPKGSVFHYHAYQVSDADCELRESGLTQENVVIVQFPDGKSYLGDISKSGKNFLVKFRHSGSVYVFDKNENILKSNGTYKVGTKANIKCTAAVAHSM